MWLEAMVVNRVEYNEDCFAGAICLDASWILLRITAVVFCSVVTIPAKNIVYVAWVCSAEIKA